MACPNAARGEDRVAWKLSADGVFSNSSAYVFLLDQDLRAPCNPFKKIWRWPGPERYRLHLWKVAKEALVTNEWRKKRQLTESECCLVCNSEEESVLHLLRDCSQMQQVWHILFAGLDLPNSFFL